MRAIMLAVVALLATSEGEPRLVTRAAPVMSLIDSNGGARVTLYAEIKGPEVEKYYCPKIVWELGELEAVEESDCAPFEQRHECRESQVGCGVIGFYLDPRTDRYVDKVKECPCTISGYPRIWRKPLYVAPPGNEDGVVEVWVRLVKNNKTIARQPIRFYVKG